MNKTLVVKDLKLDFQTFSAQRKNKKINLTPLEFKFLKLLMENKGSVVSRQTILKKVWNFNKNSKSRVADIYMGYLRKKIDSGFKNKLLVSVRGFGYMMVK